MLASRLGRLLPALSAAEALQVTILHLVAGQLGDGGLIRTRPFRELHHSASIAALVGGGPRAKPVEISLAQNGVLFLDELAEFARPVLGSLRQLLETGKVVVTRANRNFTYAARFQLVAAMNPCRCGYLGYPVRACGCAPTCGRRYAARVSGPMIDRFDLIIEVPDVTADIINFDEDAALLLKPAVEQSHLSTIAYHKIQQVVRTIANLKAEAIVSRATIAEVLAYRAMPLLA